MATQTTNYNLTKIALTDAPPDITAINPNWDTIDAQLKLNADSRLSANKTVYVTTSGNDTTGNGTQASPYRTITKALSTIPKNQNGFNATVNIGGGTYSENIEVKDYTGVIYFTGTPNTTVTFNTMLISKSTVRVTNINLSSSYNGIHIDVANGGVFFCETNVTLTNNYGVRCTLCSKASFIGTFTASSLSTCAEVSNNSVLYIKTINGTASNGIVAVASTVYYELMNATVTVKHSTSQGGRIFSGSQNNAPSY